VNRKKSVNMKANCCRECEKKKLKRKISNESSKTVLCNKSKCETSNWRKPNLKRRQRLRIREYERLTLSWSWSRRSTRRK